MEGGDTSIDDVGERRKGKSKRKRESSTTSSTYNPNKKSHGSPLKDLILAISTHDGAENEGQSTSTRDVSYNSVAKLCREAGATVTGQVHKRVCFLICTPSSVRKATQRVRKAIKKGIRLIDVTWVQRCLEENQKVDHVQFCLDHLFEPTTRQSSDQEKTDTGISDELHVSKAQAPLEHEEGWSEPVDLGCCCVCHENGADDCEWCVDCSISKQERRKAAK